MRHPSNQSDFAVDDVDACSRQICLSIKQPPSFRTSMMELPQNASALRAPQQRMRVSKRIFGGDEI